jgi:7-cyano-7-deazaguanine synthase
VYFSLPLETSSPEAGGKEDLLANLERAYPKGHEETIRRGRAVVCASGGLDSCVAVAIAAREHELALRHVNYGQRTEAKELHCFRAIADHYGVKARLVTDLPLLRDIGGFSLTDSALEMPDGETHGQEVPSTYVPFRNAILLSLGIAWAFI